MRSAARFLNLTVILIAFPYGLTGQNPGSCYSPLVSGPSPTLSAAVQSINGNGGVVVSGGDTAKPSASFQLDWGDSSTTSGLFPQRHVYANKSQNYVITITATENDGAIQHYSVPVFFVAPTFTKQSFPNVSFQIPSGPVTSESHYPGLAAPKDVEPFGDNSFTTYGRQDMAYLLTSIASIDFDFASGNTFMNDGVFSINMLKGKDYSGTASYWFTTPLAVGSGSTLIGPSPQWNQLFKEIGEDTTLNSPANLTYGGNTSGPASEIYSETMGNIFAYASGCQLISNAATYGIGKDVTTDITNSMVGGAAELQQAFNAYVAAGAQFDSWNPGTGKTDPTLGTTSTLSWKFIEHAEQQGQGYQIPLNRMMSLLQMFNPSMLAAYAPQSNTQEAATFRSTLMVTALSYAFSEDLRAEFEALNFPIDDATYEALYQLASGSRLDPALTVAASTASIGKTQPLTVTIGVNGSTKWLTAPTGTVRLTGGGYNSAAIALNGGTSTITIPAGSLAVGSDTLTATYTPDASSSSTYSAASKSLSVKALDATPAGMVSPVPGSTLTGASTTFTWNAGSGVTSYYLWVGTSAGTNNLVNIGPLSTTTATVNLPTNGAPLYVRLWSVAGSTFLYNDYTYTEFTPPPAVMLSPVPGTMLTGQSTTFTWSAGSTGTTGYYLWIGTSFGTNNLFNMGPISGTSITVTLPTNDATIYVRLWSVLNGTTFSYHDYTYSEFSTAGMISPALNSTLTAASTTFTWSAGPSGTSAYYLWVGTSPGTNNLANMGPLSTTTATVNLPTDGARIYVRLWTVINGTFVFSDYYYYEYTPPATAMVSPAPGGTLPGAMTTFTWNTGPSGTTGYYLWVGTAFGTNNLVNLGPITGTSLTVNLPTGGSPVFVRLWTVLNNQKFIYNDYMYTEAP